MLDKTVQYFLALAETRNFTRAAESIFVTQPAFSRKIAELEKELGCKLFLRDSRPIELTPAGETFLKWAKRLTENVKLMREDMEKARQGILNTLRIGYNGASHLPFLSAVLNRVKESYPHMECISVRGEPPRLESLLADGELDGIFTSLPHASRFSWMEYITLKPGGIYALLNVAHPLAHSEGVTLAQLAEEPYVNFERQMSPAAYDFVAEAFRKAGVPRNDAVIVKDVEELAVMVNAGRGYHLMSQSTAEAFHSEKARAIPVLDFPTGYDLVFAWHAAHANPSLSCLRDVLHEMYKN